ncbi:MAG: hypothetical protein E7425_05255 [Ruminococcaceae bacterium]|nr:hypothetical protein [Oscillospiraceae bacterium]
MKLFLTGEIQVGKSTALRRFLEMSGLEADGLMTFWRGRYDDLRELCIAPYGDEQAGRVCVRHKAGSPPEVYSAVFDGYGADIITASGKRDAAVLDELGRFERNSPRFCAAVIRLLDGDATVLGVIKPENGLLLDAVRAHPKVRVLTVTEENRDGIPDEMMRIFKSESL